MLRVADNRPEALKVCMQAVVKMVEDGTLNPKIGGKYSVDDIAEAHDFLGGRKSIGKVAVHW